MTKADGLMAIASRYYNVGHLAADQARRILVNKESPENMRIRRLRRFSFIINMETAHKLKMYPPMGILRYAEVIKAGAADGAQWVIAAMLHKRLSQTAHMHIDCAAVDIDILAPDLV